jgi:hypothetical protein
MPVNIISHAKNPRRPISSIGSVIKVFAHKEEDFPELKKVIPSATVRALAKQIRVPSTNDDILVQKICSAVDNTSVPAEEVLLFAIFPSS